MKTDSKIDLILDGLKAVQQDLKEFKADVNRRFDEMDKRFDRMEVRQDRLENRQEKMDDVLHDIWKHRDRLKVQMTWDFLWKSVAVNGVVLVVVGALFLR